MQRQQQQKNETTYDEARNNNNVRQLRIRGAKNGMFLVRLRGGCVSPAPFPSTKEHAHTQKSAWNEDESNTAQSWTTGWTEGKHQKTKIALTVANKATHRHTHAFSHQKSRIRFVLPRQHTA